MYGTANGSRICRNCREMGACNDRDSRMSSSGVALRPLVVETTSGKNVIMQVITTRGSVSAPNVTTIIGAIATIGVDWMMTMSGETVRDSSRDFTIITASGMLIANDTAKPMRTTRSVAQMLL